MSNTKGFEQRLNRSVVLAVRLLASFVSTAHAGPDFRHGAEARLYAPPFFQTAPHAHRYGASPRFGTAARGDSDMRYGDERDVERFLRNE